MSTTKIVRKIPIRTVSKATNNPPPQQQPSSETSPVEQQPPSSNNTTNTTNNHVNNNNSSPTTSTTTNNTTTQLISNSSSSSPTTQPSINTNATTTASIQQPQQQSTIKDHQSNITDDDHNEEDDLFNPKINYGQVEKQAIKFRKFSKAFIISKRKEQVRFYLPKVEQVIPQRDSKCSIVPISICILYHRQNGGEYALCIFKDKNMIDLCPLIVEKTEVGIVLNPSKSNQNNHQQRSALQILSENLQGMAVEYYLQFDSEVQLLSVYSALDKSLLYNGLDIKESIPTFNSLLITYSSRQTKEVTSPRVPTRFKWCQKYVEQYSSQTAVVVQPESLRMKPVKSSRKTEENDTSPVGSYSRGSRLSQTEDNNSYSPVDETRRRYLEDNDDSLGSRHFIPSGDENTSDSSTDGGRRRRHREAIIAKASPIQSSPLLERKLEEDLKYRPTTNNNNTNNQDNNSDDESSSPTTKNSSQTTSSTATATAGTATTTTSPAATSGTTEETSPTNPSTKKVIKRVVKRIPAKNATE